MLFDYEKATVRWALAKGRAAIFADCGLGKTIMQLEWANQLCKRTLGTSIILAPLAVAEQTKREGEEFGIAVNICESQADVKTNAINITNYEKIDKFVMKQFDIVVLDESSILKSFTGKIRTKIIEAFAGASYRLACTATPAPNDYMELGNHAQFLGVMTREEMLAMYFTHDGSQTSKWRLKGHAQDVFWQWLASWAVVIQNPADLGFDGAGFDLPDLRVHQIIVDGDEPVTEAMTLTERRIARKETLQLRCQKAAEIADEDGEQCIIWCDLNDESKSLAGRAYMAKEITGATKYDKRIEYMDGFTNLEVKTLVTKASIAGFGMNWQNCNKMVFVGISDSYEKYYQAVRRCWRFGQTQPVDVYIVISAKEGCVLDNINRKDADAKRMQAEMRKYTMDITRRELHKTTRIKTEYDANKIMLLPNWEEFNGSNKSDSNTELFAV